MKKMTFILAAAFAVLGLNAQASEQTGLAHNIAVVDLQLSIANEIHTNNLINWKVGEFQELNLGMMGMPVGTMKKYVASEEGNTLWLKQEMSGQMVGNHLVEAQLDRATGKILKLIQDGKEQAIPDDKLEIIDQETASVTVPAGTFECIHIKAKSEKIKSLEVWANPRDITLDGSAKTTIDSGMMPISMELTKMGGR